MTWHSGLPRRLASWCYYGFARIAPGRKIHNYLRRQRHYRRYGLKTTFMFNNVELEINSMCNRKCHYCPNVFSSRPLAYMDEKLFRKIIADLEEVGFDGAVSYHFYGEPLLDRRLSRFVEYTVRRLPQCRPIIYTNGDFLSIEVLRQFISIGVGKFLVTQHDNCLPTNLQQILDAASAEEKRHIDIRLAKSLTMINRSGLVSAGPHLTRALTEPCDWLLGTLVITTTGNIVLCCNDYYETEVVGNVRTHSVADIWCSERFEYFRSALSKGDRSVSKLCASCNYVPDEVSRSRIIPQ